METILEVFSKYPGEFALGLVLSIMAVVGAVTTAYCAILEAHRKK